MEDAIAVIDGRPEVIDEILGVQPDVRGRLATESHELLADRRFVDSLDGFLLPDPASQARLPLLLHRLRTLAIRHEPRLTLDDLRGILARRPREVTRKATADGTLLTGGTVRQLAEVLVE